MDRFTSLAELMELFHRKDKKIWNSVHFQTTVQCVIFYIILARLLY